MNKAQQWTVDACEDANGFSTLRVYDGGEHGDTSQEPIATVYIEENAQRIVACVNACAGYDTEDLREGRDLRRESQDDQSTIDGLRQDIALLRDALKEAQEAALTK